MSTDFDRLDALYPLPPEELFRQWVISQDERTVPEGWQNENLHGWRLLAHPDAKICKLRAADGTPVGWAIEPLAYLSQSGDVLVGQDLLLPIEAHAPPEDFERVLYGRDSRGLSTGNGLEGGTWVAVVFGGPPDKRFARVYVGSIHSVVFSGHYRSVATTHNLIPGLRRDLELSRAFDPLAADFYFTFGLTAHRELRRLLPNHYLDLGTFRSVRHWPAEALEYLSDGEDGAASIVEHARRLIRIISTENRLFKVFLSAGRDSRAVLACTRPLLEEGVGVVLATSVGRDLLSRIDLQAARRLARITGLPHEVTRSRPHDGEAPDVMHAFVRIGELMSGPSLSKPHPASTGPVDPSFKLAGMAGEIGRTYYWSYGLPQTVTPEELVRRTGSPATDTVIEAAQSWLEGLSEDIRSRPHDVLDLAYVEQRLGGWESPSRYIFPGRPRVNSPMASTFNIQTMLRLPKEYRVAKLLQRDMVRYGWPELLPVPFNEAAGFLKLSQYVARARSSQRYYLRRIRRKLLAS